MLNILTNAAKFTEAGQIKVSLSQKGDQVIWSVADTGPGIPADKQDTIFKPFRQLDRDKSKAQGTGLGLPISRQLVQKHGGTDQRRVAAALQWMYPESYLAFPFATEAFDEKGVQGGGARPSIHFGLDGGNPESR